MLLGGVCSRGPRQATSQYLCFNSMWLRYISMVYALFEKARVVGVHADGRAMYRQTDQHQVHIIPSTSYSCQRLVATVTKTGHGDISPSMGMGLRIGSRYAPFDIPNPGFLLSIVLQKIWGMLLSFEREGYVFGVGNWAVR